jgi:cyclopropane fatty-acyl-phospholipid synthase-like methyltransferase
MKVYRYQMTDELIYEYSMGPNPIKLMEWNLRNIRVSTRSNILDFGSGKGLTSVYLGNELSANVIAFDKDAAPSRARQTMQACKPDVLSKKRFPRQAQASRRAGPAGAGSPPAIH